MDIFLQFKHIFHDQSYFSAIAFVFKFLNSGTNRLKKKIGSIDLTILTSDVLKYFTALPHKKRLFQRFNIVHWVPSKNLFDVFLLTK